MATTLVDVKHSISFNTLLESTGLNPNQVKLLRHKGNGPGGSPYSLWFSDQSAFDCYQSLQADPSKLNREYLASFVVTPSGDTLFVGIYKNHGALGLAPEGAICPVAHVPLQEVAHLFQLEKTNLLSDLEGRLVIYWDPAATRMWAHNADGGSPKYVLEIKKDLSEESFPGFHDFIYPINQLANMPSSWKERLAQMQGVYLLVCQETGKQYVGSAFGEEGFWARWECYLKTGHGGNLGMKAHTTSGYQVSILEIASSSDTPDSIQAKESSWKEKLGTREFNGLNLN